MVRVAPALAIMIRPPKEQLVVHGKLRAGVPDTVTSGLPGVQGTGIGVHGCGVRTPMAADVALATAGLSSDVHKPKGLTFTLPTLSSTVASGLPSTKTCLSGRTLSVPGARPKEHVIVAVEVTRGALIGGYASA